MNEKYVKNEGFLCVSHGKYRIYKEVTMEVKRYLKLLQNILKLHWYRKNQGQEKFGKVK